MPFVFCLPDSRLWALKMDFSRFIDHLTFTSATLLGKLYPLCSEIPNCNGHIAKRSTVVKTECLLRKLELNSSFLLRPNLLSHQKFPDLIQVDNARVKVIGPILVNLTVLSYIQFCAQFCTVKQELPQRQRGQKITNFIHTFLW